MRLRRKRHLARALVKANQLKSIQDYTSNIRQSDIILVSTVRNEAIRMPYFLRYYRELGVNHFLFVDNDSSDGFMDTVAGASDISV